MYVKAAEWNAKGHIQWGKKREREKKKRNNIIELNSKQKKKKNSWCSAAACVSFFLCLYFSLEKQYKHKLFHLR